MKPLQILFEYWLPIHLMVSFSAIGIVLTIKACVKAWKDL
jgi:hypothetical protein